MNFSSWKVCLWCWAKYPLCCSLEFWFPRHPSYGKVGSQMASSMSRSCSGFPCKVGRVCNWISSNVQLGCGHRAQQDKDKGDNESAPPFRCRQRVSEPWLGESWMWLKSRGGQIFQQGKCQSCGQGVNICYDLCYSCRPPPRKMNSIWSRSRVGLLVWGEKWKTCFTNIIVIQRKLS